MSDLDGQEERLSQSLMEANQSEQEDTRDESDNSSDYSDGSDSSSGSDRRVLADTSNLVDK